MLNAFGMEVGANGDALTTTNTGATSLILTGGSGIISTTHPAHGTRAALFTATTTSGGCYVEYAFGSTLTAVPIRKYVYITAYPSADTGIIWLGNGGSQRSHVELTTTGAIRLRDDANAAKWNGTVTTSVGTLALNTLYRIELYITASATTGTFRLVAYAGDGTTPLTNLDSGTMTGQNTGDGYTHVRIGAKTSTGTNTATIYVDDVAYDTTGTGLIGPYVTTLATPVVTLGTTTNPSHPGAADGQQPVSWPGISGATGYDAYKAPGSSPAQGDFVLVASGVTSPYTFTGLSDGTYSYGIQAKG